MGRLFFLFFLVISTSLTTWGSEHPNNIIACDMTQGMAHGVSQSPSGAFVAAVVFPFYFESPSEAILEQKKKEWSEWDGVEEPPSDPRILAFSVPLVDSNVMSSDLKRLQKKVNFFKKLFPSTGANGEVPESMGLIRFQFAKEECRMIDGGPVLSVACENSAPLTINGVVIDRVSLRMSSQVTAQILFSEHEPQGVSELRNSVSANVTFLHDGAYYASSFTYKPDDSATRCWVKGQSLPPTSN